MDILLTSVSGAVGTIVLNRPEKRNALNTELVAALHAAILQMGANPDVRVVVLRGEGSAFCAGADLAYLQQISTNSVLDNLQDSKALKEMFQAIVECPKPVIASVHGPAIAGGCGLATVCDFVIAARTNAQFGYSEVKIGFIPAIVSVYLIRKIGDSRARHLLLGADTIGAEQAERIGLVTFVTDDDKLASETDELAERLAKNSSSAMALTKEMLSNLHGMALDAGLEYATAMNALARQTEDCKNGIDRFLKSTKGLHR